MTFAFKLTLYYFFKATLEDFDDGFIFGNGDFFRVKRLMKDSIITSFRLYNYVISTVVEKSIHYFPLIRQASPATFHRLRGKDKAE